MDLLFFILLPIIIIICISVSLYVYYYNKIQDLIIKLNEVENIIDTSLRNKYDYLNKSISIIKGNKIEIKSEIFDEIIKLRARKISNFDLDRKLLDGYIELESIINNNDKLKQSEELVKIKNNIEEIDDNLTNYRQYYNDNISIYNRTIKTIPTSIIAKIHKYQEKLFFDMKNMNDDDYRDFKLWINFGGLPHGKSFLLHGNIIPP